MIRRPQRSTRTDTLFPYTTLFRSHPPDAVDVAVLAQRKAGRDFQVAALEDHHAGPVLLGHRRRQVAAIRSEEHTSELQSLMRISYAVFCLQKKNTMKD